MKISRYFVLFTSLFAFLLGICPQFISAQTPLKNPQIAKNLPDPKEVSQDSIKSENSISVTENSNTKPNSEKLLNRIGTVSSQPISLTLNDAIKRALENNNEIEIAKTDVRIAESNLRSLLGIYDFTLTYSPTFSRQSSTGAADSALTNRTATNVLQHNFSIDRPISFGGGNYSTFYNTRRTAGNLTFTFITDPNTGQTVPVPVSTNQNTNELGFNYTQPLLRNRSIDNTRRQIKIQRKRISQSDADFRRQTIQIISQVQTAYWDLVFALRDQQNKVANLNLAKENLRQIEAKIDAGSAAPLERAEVETELANREADVLLAAQQIAINENQLKQLILRDQTNPDWTNQLVPTDKPIFSNDPVDLDLAIKDAIENRPELSRLKLEKEVNKIDVSFFKNQTLPQLDLNSGFSLQSVANSRNAAGLPGYLTGGYGQSVQNLFRTDAPNYSVGVTISIPFRNKTAKADLATARIQEERIEAQTRSQEQGIIVEVRNAVQAVETAKQRVLTARRARENAEKQLEGERQLYEAGKSTTFLLFQRENTLTNARNSEIRAETDLNKAYSDLQRATSTTFRANGIELESPMEDK
ncbi:MAG TPA: TolC family protein [Pyrinomonadaceae bacterium]|nr:TolC family protein [Pyrinomonadaceae bacterium]